MASLHKLLSQEGFDTQKSRELNKKVKFKNRNIQENSIALPIYICHDLTSFDSSNQRSEKTPSLKGSVEKNSVVAGGVSRKQEPAAIDDVAIKAMVAILTGYIGQYLRDENFRASIKEKCYSCFKKASDSEIFSHMEMGIHIIENLVQSPQIDLESLQKSIKIFKIVASLDTNLSPCAHLYLSIIYRFAKNDKISARHLLQVFSESPFLARTHLLHELWDHFFLPHVLHVKIWYNKELEFLASSFHGDEERKIEALKQQYNELMDNGTRKFALYYKEWLKVGGEAPSIPRIPLPSKQTYARSRRKSESSTSNKSLYQAVFGPIVKRQSMDLVNGNGVWDLDVKEDIKHCSYVEKKAVAHRRSSNLSNRTHKAELWPDNQKSDYFRFLGCRTEPTECLVQGSYVSNIEKIKDDEDEKIDPFQLNDTARAIATICSSESLTDCETAVRAVSEAWLNSHGDPKLETLLSQASVIQGILEVLYVSRDDEILELAVSLLAEVATKSEANRKCVLCSDPQLLVSIRLMRSSSLFLKAAVLLYLVKPKADQMVSIEWIPLVLRVLEFGDQLQILFTVRCSPHEAAYYFLNELLTGFHDDKNLENARQIVSLGGLSLLVRRMEEGNTYERSKAASIIRFCIRADGTCRHYLVKNLKKDTILSLLVLEKQMNSHGHALALLTELLCLSRRNERIEYLTRLTKGWGCLNTMHILLHHLQMARPEEQPIIAVIMLQLDLMGDPLEYSVYREEAIDAIVKAVESFVFDEKIQEQSARALLILGGHFSYTGEPETEKWLLRKAGLKNTQHDRHLILNEEDENWQRKAARVLLTKRLLSALSDSIANSIPCLARASLVTVCWMSSYLHSLGDNDLQLEACSILVPRLIECLNENADNLEDKILASFSLHNLTKGTDYLLRRSQWEKEVLDCLQKLSRVTWTAKELISVMTNN